MESGESQMKLKQPSSTTTTSIIRRVGRKRRENRMMNFRMEEKMILDRILGKGIYDARIRPVGVVNSTGNIKKYVLLNKFYSSSHGMYIA